MTIGLGRIACSSCNSLVGKKLIFSNLAMSNVHCTGISMYNVYISTFLLLCTQSFVVGISR